MYRLETNAYGHKCTRSSNQSHLAHHWISSTQKYFCANKNLDVGRRIAELLDKGTPRFFQHLNLCVYFSIDLAQTLSWTNESTLFKLTMASLLHDVAAIGLEELEMRVAKGEHADRLPLSFRRHPFESAHLAQKLRDAPPDVDRIILEHHELPDGSGFPNNLKGSELSPLSVIFILAHNLTDVVLSGNVGRDLKRSILLDRVPTYLHSSSAWKELLRNYGQI